MSDALTRRRFVVAGSLALSFLDDAAGGTVALAIRQAEHIVGRMARREL